MVGIVVLVGWTVVGLVVAGIETSSHRQPERSTTTALGVAGALAGGYVGQSLGLYVFGEMLGFLFSAGGAVLLIRLYRSRVPATTPPPELTTPLSPPAPSASLATRLAEAIGWGGICGVAAAGAGLAGQLFGSALYPQRYEQIPSEFFFVPLGFIAGAVSAATVRLAFKQWGVPRMFAVVTLVSVAYGGLMFDYAKHNTIAWRAGVTVEPNPAKAVRCEPGACREADSLPVWLVEGHVRVDHRGLGGTVDAISLMSYEGPHPGRPTTKKESDEMARFAGPRVRLTGRQLGAPRTVAANGAVSYPVRYAYRTFRGDAERTIAIYVEFTDRLGNSNVTVAKWDVR